MGSIHTSVMPASLYGVALVCEATREAAGWRPSIGLALERTLTATARTDSAVPGSDMAADLTLGRLFVAPVSLRSGSFELRPAATFEIGRLAASGSGTGLRSGGDDVGVWVAGGALAQVVLHAAGDWGLELAAGGQIPLTRYTFRFKENVEAYHMGAIGFLGTASLLIGLM
jgi:hypothetical protein